MLKEKSCQAFFKKKRICISIGRYSAEWHAELRIGFSMFCVGYGIYMRERNSRVYIS